MTVSTQGDAITMRDGRLVVPTHPVIPFIEGDGTGPDIWRASQHVFDGAVGRAYGGKRRVAWLEVMAGEKAKNQLNSWLPDDTLAAIDHYLVAIKGPLTTPVGGGFRSPPYARCTAASNTFCDARQMSGPVPSPSMNGMTG
jgi:isocitrate dehydrogenase